MGRLPVLVDFSMCDIDGFFAIYAVVSVVGAARTHPMRQLLMPILASEVKDKARVKKLDDRAFNIFAFIHLFVFSIFLFMALWVCIDTRVEIFTSYLPVAKAGTWKELECWFLIFFNDFMYLNATNAVLNYGTLLYWTDAFFSDPEARYKNWSLSYRILLVLLCTVVTLCYFVLIFKCKFC